MDAGLAALLGATIGGIASLLAGFFGPWVREAVTRRAMRKEAAQLALREQIVAIVDSFGVLLRSKQAGGAGFNELHTNAAVGITRLAVLLTSDQVGVEKLLGMVLNTIAQMRPALGSIAMTAMQALLHEWYRGDIKASAIVELYKANLMKTGGFVEDPDVAVTDGSALEPDKATPVAE